MLAKNQTRVIHKFIGVIFVFLPLMVACNSESPIASVSTEATKNSNAIGDATEAMVKLRGNLPSINYSYFAAVEAGQKVLVKDLLERISVDPLFICYIEYSTPYELIDLLAKQKLLDSDNYFDGNFFALLEESNRYKANVYGTELGSGDADGLKLRDVIVVSNNSIFVVSNETDSRLLGFPMVNFEAGDPICLSGTTTTVEHVGSELFFRGAVLYVQR